MEIDLTNLSQMIPPIFFPAFRFRGRFLVLYGGSGSGKSYFAADKLLVRAMKEDKHNILCVRDTGRSVTKSQFPLLEGEIKRWGLYDLFSINRSQGNERITFKANDNQLIFSGLDDVEKLKSIYDISSIWIEEANEVSPEDFRELNRRLRGYTGKNRDGSAKYMQIILTFNPVSELSWLKARFFDGQPIIYGTEQAQAANGVNNSDTLVIHSTYQDNPFIDGAYAAEMEGLKKYDEDEYNIYTLGLWGMPGGIYFDRANVAARIRDERLKAPLRRGYFEYEYINELIVDSTIRWVDDSEGMIRIYTEPIKGHPYVGGGDTAGEGSDYNVGQFTDNTTETDVATLRANCDEDLYARQMYCLGRYYNSALLGIETNFSTHPVKELTRLGYHNQYVREETPDSYTGKLAKRYGFQTNKVTRPLALGMLRTVMREHPERVRDLDTLDEMTVFIKNEKGRPEAAEGQHDDCIMARAINCYIASQQSMIVKAEPVEKPKKLADKLGIRKQTNDAFKTW